MSAPVSRYDMGGLSSEGCDRKLFYDVLKRGGKGIMFQLPTWPNPDKCGQRLYAVRENTPCKDECSWLIWMNYQENRIYIQHGINEEHTRWIDCSYLVESNWGFTEPFLEDWKEDYLCTFIKSWVERVHEHLERVKSDDRDYDWFALPPFPGKTT